MLRTTIIGNQKKKKKKKKKNLSSVSPDTRHPKNSEMLCPEPFKNMYLFRFEVIFIHLYSLLPIAADPHRSVFTPCLHFFLKIVLFILNRHWHTFVFFVDSALHLGVLVIRSRYKIQQVIHVFQDMMKVSDLT